MDTKTAIWSHIAYLAISVAATIWVARTLYRNGRRFLVDTFRGDENLADSVNRLLVVGFYLVNVGYVSVAIRFGDRPYDLPSGLEFVVMKVGLVFLILGVMHFLNLAIFASMRRRAQP